MLCVEIKSMELRCSFQDVCVCVCEEFNDEYVTRFLGFRHEFCLNEVLSERKYLQTLHEYLYSRCIS
ncbi:hypothetical protein CDL12_17383 [Handroanthus impetiginosus]|uniref:Uncharacterized protein n=1 Tax=Handroanthus impetiginosus TaxID=429701 RepID=A0A2G9GXM5_9LAMI|nr:hypothetical protein CDL12_17383 [Handroanthus impetiginosus]